MKTFVPFVRFSAAAVVPIYTFELFSDEKLDKMA